jgi:hypothetical protein
MGLQANSSNETSHGTSQFNRTSFWFRRTSLLRCLQAGPQTIRANLLHPAIQGINGTKLAQQSVAVFAPTPGTPGMLSTASPNQAQPIHNLRGFHACLGLDFLLAPKRVGLVAWVEQANLGETSCIKSLSELAMTTSKPSATAWRVRAAMQSSASQSGLHERKNTGRAQVGHDLVELLLQSARHFGALRLVFRVEGHSFRSQAAVPNHRPGGRV